MTNRISLKFFLPGKNISRKFFGSGVQVNVNVLLGNIVELRKLFENTTNTGNTSNGQISISHNEGDLRVETVKGGNGTSSK